MVILTTINNRKYQVDVGFGNFGAIGPILLEEGVQVPCVPGAEARLVYRAIANYTTDQKLWVLEIRNAMSNVWAAGYCFSELEFLPQDFELVNYRTYNDPTSHFTYQLIVTKVLLDEQGGEEAVGTVTLIG